MVCKGGEAFWRRGRFFVVGAVILTTALLMAACGGGPAPAPIQPAGAPTSKPAAPAAKDLQERIGSSANRTFGVEGQVLPSYHLEIIGSEPTWNAETKKAETRTYTLKADVSGEDVYLLSTTATGGEPAQTTEGYIIKGGLSKSEQGGKEYEVVGGKLNDSFFMGLTWALAPLNIAFPLAIAATGPTPQGQEVIDGRTAEKYGVDSANSPAGTMGILGQMFTITASKGTVWVDKETGALLKASLTFEQNLVDPPGSTTVVGTGSGKIEVLVTKVGQVTVKLPK